MVQVQLDSLGRAGSSSGYTGLGTGRVPSTPPGPFNWVCLGISWSLDLQGVQGEKGGISRCSCHLRWREDGRDFSQGDSGWVISSELMRPWVSSKANTSYMVLTRHSLL